MLSRMCEYVEQENDDECVYVNVNIMCILVGGVYCIMCTGKVT